MDESSQVFSFFHIAIRSDAKIKPRFPITRGRLFYLMQYFCNMMKSELLGVKAIDNYVHLLVKLDAAVVMETFIGLLIKWTSYWITGLKPEECSFWEEGFWLKALSPEDKQAAVDLFGQESLSMSISLPFFHNTADPNTSKANCHHIIFATARYRVILSTKFRLQLYDAIREICSEMGSTMISTASSRNHVHLLCYIPFFSSITNFYNELRERLTQWMPSNIHYRRVDELSTEFVAYSVSRQGLNHEEYIIAHQDDIHNEHKHMDRPIICEEHQLYKRLGQFIRLKLK